MKLFKTKTNTIEKRISIMNDITIIANHIYRNGNSQHYIDTIYSYIKDLKTLGLKPTEVKSTVKSALLQSLLNESEAIFVLRIYKDLWSI